MMVLRGRRHHRRIRLTLFVLLFGIAWLPATTFAYAVGAVNGSFEVTGAGQASFAVKIEIPPGVNDLAPQLSIAYVSGGGNGLLGLGAHLNGLSSITRCGRTIAQDGVAGGVQHDADDRFCLDGQRLISISGVYGANGSEYRTEIDAFQKVIANGSIAYSTGGSGPESFTVLTKAGGRIYFGTTTDAQIKHPDTGVVHRWWVSQLHDVHGNTIDYEFADYTAAGDIGVAETERIPAAIRYGRNDSQGVGNSLAVEFEYEPRPDPIRAFANGIAFRVAKRLTHIKTYSGAALVRDYRVGYGTSPSTGSSRMTSVTECAGDVAVCLPPTTFAWQDADTGWSNGPELPPDDLVDGAGRPRGLVIDINNDGRTDWVTAVRDANGAEALHTWLNSKNGWASSAGYAPPSALTSYHTTPAGLHLGELVDLNGDGLPDWILSYAESGTATQQVWLNTGNGWSSDARFLLPEVLTDIDGAPDGMRRAQLIDLNGDALADVVVATRTPAGEVILGAWRNTGSSWVAAPEFAPPEVQYDYAAGIATGIIYGRFADINGDGLPDWVRSVQTAGGSIVFSTWINTGSGWLLDSDYELPTVLLSYVDDADGRALADLVDVNGDGLPDLVSAYKSDGVQTLNVWLNTGAGWLYSPDYQPVTFGVDYSNGSANAYGSFLDVTGDGVADMVRSYQTTGGTYVNAVWKNTNPGWVPDNSFALPTALIKQRANADSIPRGMLADTNGDGAMDLVVAMGGESPRTFLSGVGGGEFAIPEVVTEIVNGLGFATRIEYVSSSHSGVYTPGAVAASGYPDVDHHGPFFLVSAVQASDGVGGWARAEHRYGGAKVNVTGRGSLGFAWHEVYDTRTGIAIDSRFEQQYPLTGWLLSTTKTLNGVALFHSNQTNSYLALNSGKTYFPYTENKTTHTYELDGSLVSTISNHASYDDHGNNTSSVTSSSDATGTYINTVHNTFADDAANWVLGKLTRAESAASAPGQTTITRTTDYRYGSEGLLTRQVVEPGHAQAVTTDYTHDGFGNQAATTVSAAGIETRNSALTFGADGRFPIQASNALGHTATKQYDDRFGVVTSAVDANGQETRYDYDEFGRKITETKARTDGEEDGRDVLVYAWCDATCPANGAFLVGVVDNQGESPETVYHDMLGREVRKQTFGFDGTPVYQDTEFDAFGRKARQSRPYFKDTEPKWTSYGYDVLGRLIRRTAANGTQTTIDHDGRTTRITNALGQTSARTVNAQGKPVVTVDAAGNQTQYQYDAVGNLVRTTDAYGNVIETGYDVFGRKISMSDPDMGTWQYQYDALGNLIRQQDAKDQAVTLEYDSLNRLVRRVEAEGETLWTYDTAANGIGRLRQVSGLDGYVRSHDYDQFGRLTRVEETIDNQRYVTETGYQGGTDRVDYVVYPSQLVVRTTYNEYGFPIEVRSAGRDAYQDYLNQYDLAQQLAQDAIDLEASLADQRQTHIDTMHYYNNLAQPYANDAQHYADLANDAVDAYNYAVGQANYYAATANQHYRIAGEKWAQANIFWREYNTAVDMYNASTTQWEVDFWNGWVESHRRSAEISEQEAQTYENAADGFAYRANWWADKANTHAKQADQYSQTANTKAEQANTYYAHASQEANAVNAIDKQVQDAVDAANLAVERADQSYAQYEGNSILHWSANEVGADGQITKFTQGNNVVTDLEYNSNTGRLIHLRTQGNINVAATLATEVIQGFLDKLRQFVSDFSQQSAEYQGKRGGALADQDRAIQDAAAARRRAVLLRFINDRARATVAEAEAQQYDKQADIHGINADLNGALADVHDASVQGAQALLAQYAGPVDDPAQGRALEAAYHDLLAVHYRAVEDLYQRLAGDYAQLATHYQSFAVPAQADRDSIGDLSRQLAQIAEYNRTRAESFAAVSSAAENLGARPDVNALLQPLNDNGGVLFGAAIILDWLADVLAMVQQGTQALNAQLEQNYLQQGDTQTASYFGLHATLYRDRIALFRALASVFRQRAEGELTEENDDNDGVGEAALAVSVDLFAVAAHNQTLSEQYAEMATNAYWEALYEEYNAEFTDAALLHNGTADDNAALAADHEDKARLARNAFAQQTLAADGVVQDDFYVYDQVGNLIERRNRAVDLIETFDYDTLNRLTQANLAGQGAELYELVGLTSTQFEYDALGNITFRSDVGNYSYGNNAGPHAVTAVSGTKNASYAYDANGNQLSGDGRVQTWTSYNKPSRIAKSGHVADMFYGPERQLIKQEETNGGEHTVTVRVGALYEKVTTATTVSHRFHVTIGGQAVAVITEISGDAPKTHYLHRDHLDSVTAITDENGFVVERFHYDPFGKRRLAVVANDPIGNLLNASTDRGYTGHKHLAGVELIHMDGRVYDPSLGRFVSADPHIQFPLFSQSLNRYSYVLNNPLNAIDPSGYFSFNPFKAVKKLFKKVAKVVKKVVTKVVGFVEKYWRPIAAITIAVVVPHIAVAMAPGVSSVAALPAMAKLAVGGIAGGLAGLVSTGSLKGALLGAASGFAFAGIGNYFATTQNASLVNSINDGARNVTRSLTSLGRAMKTFAHGAVGGVAGRMSGASFSKAFLSTGFTQAFAPGVGRIAGFRGDQFARVGAGAMVSGIASELAGGRFAKGAMLGAFSRWFNDEWHKSGENKNVVRVKQPYRRVPVGASYPGQYAATAWAPIEFMTPLGVLRVHPPGLQFQYRNVTFGDYQDYRYYEYERVSDVENYVITNPSHDLGFKHIGTFPEPTFRSVYTETQIRACLFGGCSETGYLFSFQTN